MVVTSSTYNFHRSSAVHILSEKLCFFPFLKKSNDFSFDTQVEFNVLGCQKFAQKKSERKAKLEIAGCSN
jgi:hypothetical protein